MTAVGAMLGALGHRTIAHEAGLSTCPFALGRRPRDRSDIRARRGQALGSRRWTRSRSISTMTAGWIGPCWRRLPTASQADLYIYLAAGDEELDLSRKPTFLKKAITGALLQRSREQRKGIADGPVRLWGVQQRL